MADIHRLPVRPAMASPWRRRTVCTVAGGPAALTAISARVAELETELALDLGAAVELAHPEAGRVPARVAARSAHGLTLHLAGDAAALGFALAAIAADMSCPA